MTVTEIVIFEASNECLNDPSMLFGAMDIALKADGVHPPCYYGFQVENKGTGYMLLNWDSYEAHKALMDSAIYTELIGLLTPCGKKDTEPEMLHVEFSAPTTALDKPVTEVTILTLKSPENRRVVVEILSLFSAASEKQLVFGKTKEDENTYVVICGWDTVEQHWETMAKPEVAAGVEKLKPLVDRNDVYHTKLSRRSPKE